MAFIIVRCYAKPDSTNNGGEPQIDAAMFCGSRDSCIALAENQALWFERRYGDKLGSIRFFEDIEVHLRTDAHEQRVAEA